MKTLAAQNYRHSIETGIAQVLAVFVLVVPSGLAFLASLTFRDLWATVPGFGSLYQACLDVSYGVLPVAVGLAGLAIYDRETSARSAVAMTALSAAGIIFTWYAGRF
jgi:hypothetical protein